VSPSPLALTATQVAHSRNDNRVYSNLGSVTAAGAGGWVFSDLPADEEFCGLAQFLESQVDPGPVESPVASSQSKGGIESRHRRFFITNIKSTPIIAQTGRPGGGTLEPTLSSFFSGVSLDITPQIDEDGNINLHIHPGEQGRERGP